jgi:hypothetical protein
MNRRFWENAMATFLAYDTYSGMLDTYRGFPKSCAEVVIICVLWTEHISVCFCTVFHKLFDSPMMW